MRQRGALIKNRMNLINNKIVLCYWMHKPNTEFKLLLTQPLNQHFECLAWFCLYFLHRGASGFQLSHINLMGMHDHMIFPSMQIQNMQVVNILDLYDDIIGKCSTLVGHTGTEVHSFIIIDAKWIIWAVRWEDWWWVCLFYV